MDLRSCRKIIIFGGSFDPPHNAHVALPQMVMRALKADAMAYVSAATPPLKRDPTTAAQHRIAMLRLAIADLPHAMVLTDELDRADDGQPSYTVDTLEDLHKKLGDKVTMRLLIGTDQLQQFDQWKQSQRVVTLAEPVVMLRPPQTRKSLTALLPAGYDADQWLKRVVDVPQMEISSTMIRQRVARGEDIEQFVPKAVARYIGEHHLYGV